MKRTKTKTKQTTLFAIGILLIACMLLGVMGLFSLKAHADTRASGTEDDPYIITTRQEFKNAFSSNDSAVYGYYKLGNDIDMNFEDWNPSVETFSGTLDGNGKTIKNFTMFINKGGNHGLIRKLYGTVKNLTIERFTVYSNLNSCNESITIGGIAGFSEAGKIYNCTVNNLQIGVTNLTTLSFVGGVVGYNHYGRIENCTTASDLSLLGNDYVGGIAGTNISGTITGCKNYGTVGCWYLSGTTPYVGGIAGAQTNSAKITGSINYGSIKFTGETSDKNYKPRMGQLLGLNGAGCTFNESYGGSSSASGAVDSGNLKQSNGFLGIGKYNQKEFVSEGCVGENLN